MTGKSKDEQEDIQEFIEEAIIDCYGEDEEFTGIMNMIEDNIVCPFEAKIIGETVKIHDFQYPENAYSLKAICEHKGKKYVVDASSIEWLKPLPEGFKWIEAYFQWYKSI